MEHPLTEQFAPLGVSTKRGQDHFDPLLPFNAAESSPSTAARMRLLNGLLLGP